MAFTVEDGSGVAGANSYVSEADADAYFTDHGIPSDWSTATSAEKEQALVKATQWIDAHYWWITGEIGGTVQALGWPRVQAEDKFGRSIDSDVVPDQVIAACCEAAVRSIAGDLEADETQKVLEEEVTGAVRVRYDPNAAQGTLYPLINQLLSGLAASGEYQAQVVRG
jgi:hypothetical protein